MEWGVGVEQLSWELGVGSWGRGDWETGGLGDWGTGGLGDWGTGGLGDWGTGRLCEDHFS